MFLYAGFSLYTFKNTGTISYAHITSRFLPESKRQSFGKESQDPRS